MFQEMLFDVRIYLNLYNNMPRNNRVWMDCKGRETHSVEVEGRGNAENNKDGEGSGSLSRRSSSSGRGKMNVGTARTENRGNKLMGLQVSASQD